MASAASPGGVYQGGNGTSNSRTRDFGLRAQKKILGRVVASGAGRSLFIDDATTSLLDNLTKLMERVAKTHPNIDKKQPEKVLKNIVKLSIKIGLLHRNNKLGPDDNKKISEIRTNLRATAMSVVSFHELDFSFDRLFLTKSLDRTRSAIQDLIKYHLTDKSQERCDQIFNFLTNPDFLDAIFHQGSEHNANLGLLVADINKALDAGHL
ncbi:tumor necrosis factor alpha-induced protein 8-like protein [Aphidius gifuensis]|nr:tumor necrosis factor alpha-induced protein 8-like protein [Aphidius gifuensis]